uniref:Uncharacterized protein n=1 Tax=viral metagenome TaxID=1070528 RepID=A0A6C0IWW2_9ZZZZ
MGDVVLLATTGRARIAFYGNEELHIGTRGSVERSTQTSKKTSTILLDRRT